MNDLDEGKIFKNISDFKEIPVLSILQPRNFVVAVEASMRFDALMKLLIKSDYSRFPVYKENIDTIIGVLHIKDLLPYLDEGPLFDWSNVLRKPLFVREDQMINDLFRELKKRKTHLAVVVDEYGGTSGIVTMEDILEEIVGEIRDEFDQEAPLFIKLSENQYYFNGLTPVSEFCEVTGLSDEFFGPEEERQFESLSGFMLEHLEDFPKAGDKVIFEEVLFRVESIIQRRIGRIFVELNAQ